ncbi:MAG: hypothetical protein GVY13_11525 [Alphaproteobacteria bacterium]|jgi:hypothetical protein|nr:hypothetical protein [Alphaproteobacteria bacterium]
MSFAEILQTSLERRTSRTMALLAPETPSKGRLPFPMAGPFLDIYAGLLRAGVFPLMVRRRQLQLLEKQYDWADDGEKKFADILKTKANPVFESWDNAWDSLWDNYDPNRRSAPANGVGRNGQAHGKAVNGHGPGGGLLGAVKGLLGRDRSAGAAERPSESAAPSEPRPMVAGLRALMERHAEGNHYLPPKDDDVTLLKEMIRVHPRSIEDAWRELTQVHRQEFAPADPKEGLRQGALAEAIIKWQYSLPHRIGELLALKAAADLEYCDANFVRQFIRQSARSQEEGERAMPYLALFQKSMVAVIR